mmetsp:Transcript_13525/g.31792  ORF Transcript_13525/g.31792 Transcript_13525/m.31792 type:complete len:293 (+) Transcript_13525:20-898(+)
MGERQRWPGLESNVQDSTEANSSSRARALYRCGLGRLRVGDQRGAYNDFKEAARLEPQNWEIWQKYEESYQAVELGEQELMPGAGCRSGTRDSRSALPPKHWRFTAQRLSEVEVEMQSLHKDFGSARGSKPPREVEERVATIDGQAHTAQRVVAAAGTLPEVAEGSAGDSVAEPPGQSMGGAYGTRIEFTVGSNQTYVVIHIAWLVTWFTVLHHYRRHRSLPAIIEMITGSLLFALVMWLLWWFRKRRAEVSISLSDAVKVISLAAMLALTIWHYCSLSEGKTSRTENTPEA